MLSFESPLSWPEDMPATPLAQRRSDHGFPPQMSFAESVGFLEQELKEMQTGAATLFLDVAQPLSDRLRKKVGSRTGACLHFKYGERNYALACDLWQGMEHNIYALHLPLRQWRNMERWGVGTLPVLMHGFEAGRSFGPGGSPGPAPGMGFLRLGPAAPPGDAPAVYHRRP